MREIISILSYLRMQVMQATNKPGHCAGFFIAQSSLQPGQPSGGLDADKPVVQRYGKTPAARAL